eukprot:6203933-Prorocentrum_lima.AAC.1
MGSACSLETAGVGEPIRSQFNNIHVELRIPVRPEPGFFPREPAPEVKGPGRQAKVFSHYVEEVAWLALVGHQE